MSREDKCSRESLLGGLSSCMMGDQREDQRAQSKQASGGGGQASRDLGFHFESNGKALWFVLLSFSLFILEPIFKHTKTERMT